MGQRIMIVGNGHVPEGAAARIDAADLVIRFNECRNFGAAGSRTDVVAVCNTGRPARAMLSGAWRDSPAVRACSEIWSVRDPDKFGELRQALLVSHPELDDFCDDSTAGFAAVAAARDKRHRVLSRDVHEAVEHALLAHEPKPYVVPSSGLIVVAQVLADVLADPGRDRDQIFLAGFSHQGWDGHPFAAERQMIEAHVASGKLVRLNPDTASFLSQGA
ncbi:MAG: Urease operon accessory protein [Rhizobium sp.]|nr:Urease operon accessory protein [Rhizobium sp.]